MAQKYGWSNESAACSVPYITPVVASLLKERRAKRIVDLGCGNGAMTARLAIEGFEITGSDRDEDGIAIAREAHPNIEFHCCEFDDLPDSIGAGFDAAISTEVIEHMFDPAKLLRCAKRLLAPGGTLVLTTPHYGWWKQAVVVATGRWDSHHQTSRVGGHIKLFSPSSLKMILQEEGFNLIEMRGAGRFPPVYKSTVVAAEPASAT